MRRIVEVAHTPPQPKAPLTTPDRERYDLPPPFHLADGRTLHEPQDLAEAALDMTEETFHHHHSRKDFGRWLREAHQHPHADHVDEAETPGQLLSAIVHGPREKAPIPITSLGREPPLFERPEPKELPPEPLPERFDLPTPSDALQAEVAALRAELSTLKDSLSAELASGMRALLVRGDHERIQLEERRLQDLRGELDAVKVELSRRTAELEAMRTAMEEEARAPRPQGLAREDSIHDHLLALVQSGRAQLARGNLGEARRTYASVRDQFYQAAIPEEEKQQLYNLIHELYTDIELASLE